MDDKDASPVKVLQTLHCSNMVQSVTHSEKPLWKYLVRKYYLQSDGLMVYGIILYVHTLGCSLSTNVM